MKKDQHQDYAETIRQMREAGQINEAQARALEDAVNVSEQRKQVLIKQIEIKKFERERRSWGFLGYGFVVLAALVGVLVLASSPGRLGRNTAKAVANVTRAGLALGRGELAQAREWSQKAIRKAPRLPLAHTLHGLVAQKQFEASGDNRYREEANAAFSQAETLIKEREGARMNGTAVFFFIVFLIFIAGGVLAVFLALYNLLVRKEESVNEAWAQVGTWVQRKVDLIPVLIDIVREYAGHEKSTLEDVVKARSEAHAALAAIEGTGAAKQEQLEKINVIQDLLAKGLGSVKVLVERYPQLKANQNYMAVQKQLDHTESSIAWARQDFNRKVMDYNTNVRQFPMNILAAWGHFDAKKYFSNEPESTTGGAR